ncbi:MAG: hypothetical protein C4338_07450 [Rhodanobacteraceae bacterium]
MAHGCSPKVPGKRARCGCGCQVTASVFRIPLRAPRSFSPWKAASPRQLGKGTIQGSGIITICPSPISIVRMSTLTEPRIRELLAGVVDPHTGIDLAASGAVRAVGVDGDRVAVEIALGYPASSYHEQLAAQIKQHLEADPAIARATVPSAHVSSRTRSRTSSPVRRA